MSSFVIVLFDMLLKLQSHYTTKEFGFVIVLFDMVLKLRGRLTFKVQGAQTLKAYVKMLLTFGEYSGLGMKTSLGMGGIKLEERKD